VPVDDTAVRVKADQIARTHIDSADRETHRARIDPIEIDKALKGRAQLRRFIVAGGAGATGPNGPQCHKTRREKPRHAPNQRQGSIRLVHPAAQGIAGS